ncbi:hypothetical protein AKJ16_DCAP07633 [Drosera capensis]
MLTIDGKRLQEATSEVVKNIEETEADRNMEEDEYLFVSSANNFRAQLICLSSGHASIKKEGASKAKRFSSGELIGSLSLADDGSQDNPEAQDRILCFSLKLRDADKHSPKLLIWVEAPEKEDSYPSSEFQSFLQLFLISEANKNVTILQTIDECDILERMLWHEYKGSRPPQTSYQGRTDSALSYPGNYGVDSRGNSCYSDRNAGASSSYGPPHVIGQ